MQYYCLVRRGFFGAAGTSGIGLAAGFLAAGFLALISGLAGSATGNGCVAVTTTGGVSTL
jgi:hypothetical protein